MHEFNEYKKNNDTTKKSISSAWDMKERDWQKDIEILKIGQEHINEYVQKKQHYNAENMLEYKAFKGDINAITSTIVSESNSLRNQWHRQIELLHSKLTTYDKMIEQHSKALLLQDSQRMDDLELLEQALNTVQSQQVRLRSSIEESISACKIDTVSACNKIDRMESPLIAIKAELTELRREMNVKDKESKQRFETIASVLKVFADSLHLSPNANADVKRLI